MACVVKTCPNSKSKYIDNGGISFHQVPLYNPEHLKKWPFKIPPNRKQAEICCEHFTPDCFKYSDKMKKLVPLSIPTLKLPIEEDTNCNDQVMTNLSNTDLNEDPDFTPESLQSQTSTSKRNGYKVKSRPRTNFLPNNKRKRAYDTSSSEDEEPITLMKALTEIENLKSKVKRLKNDLNVAEKRLETFQNNARKRSLKNQVSEKLLDELKTLINAPEFINKSFPQKTVAKAQETITSSIATSSSSSSVPESPSNNRSLSTIIPKVSTSNICTISSSESPSNNGALNAIIQETTVSDSISTHSSQNSSSSINTDLASNELNTILQDIMTSVPDSISNNMSILNSSTNLNMKNSSEQPNFENNYILGEILETTLDYITDTSNASTSSLSNITELTTNNANLPSNLNDNSPSPKLTCDEEPSEVILTKNPIIHFVRNPKNNLKSQKRLMECDISVPINKKTKITASNVSSTSCQTKPNPLIQNPLVNTNSLSNVVPSIVTLQTVKPIQNNSIAPIAPLSNIQTVKLNTRTIFTPKEFTENLNPGTSLLLNTPNPNVSSQPSENEDFTIMTPEAPENQTIEMLAPFIELDPSILTTISTTINPSFEPSLPSTMNSNINAPSNIKQAIIPNIIAQQTTKKLLALSETTQSSTNSLSNVNFDTENSYIILDSNEVPLDSNDIVETSST